MFSEQNPRLRQNGAALESVLNFVLFTAAMVAFPLQALSYRYTSDDPHRSFHYAGNWASGDIVSNGGG